MLLPDLVTTTINYGVPPADSTIHAHQSISANPESGAFEKNYVLQAHDMQVENVRGKEETVGLDTAGFQFYCRPSKVSDFGDREKIKKEYYAESEQIIKDVTGATKVVIFAHSGCARTLTDPPSAPIDT